MNFTMSTFNTDYICNDCLDTEQQHPEYKKAKEAAYDAIMRDDYDFPGVGKPEDL